MIDIESVSKLPSLIKQEIKEISKSREDFFFHDEFKNIWIIMHNSYVSMLDSLEKEIDQIKSRRKNNQSGL